MISSIFVIFTSLSIYNKKEYPINLHGKWRFFKENTIFFQNSLAFIKKAYILNGIEEINNSCGVVLKGLRERFAKPRCMGSNPIHASIFKHDAVSVWKRLFYFLYVILYHSTGNIIFYPVQCSAAADRKEKYFFCIVKGKSRIFYGIPNSCDSFRKNRQQWRSHSSAKR